MKKIVSVLTLSLFGFASIMAQQAKYVFFFIGDGMGINQVFGTEMYLGELQGRIGPDSLLMTQFPYTGLSKTYSHSNSITDSAAGGTALAVGEKTTNGVLGMDWKKEKSLESVAEKAKKAGRNVGIATSVSIDHATPASFYAHQPSRKMYYEIGTDLVKSGFDFFGGSEFLSPVSKDDKNAPSLYQQAGKAGYTIARGYDEYQQKSSSERIILLQKEGKYKYSVPFAIDRKDDDLNLCQITTAAIDFLTRNDKGFFVMLEGGMIDWSSHSNDAMTTFNEVKDMDNAVKIAYEFYKQHPDSTLIVITADHETGGLALGNKKYDLMFKKLKGQKMSQYMLSKEMGKFAASTEDMTWEKMLAFLDQNLSFGKDLTAEQQQSLKAEYDRSVARHQSEKSKSEYFEDEKLAAMAIRVLNEVSKVGWTTSDHSAACVPVFAVGAGAEMFTGLMENVEIPQKIAKAAGY